jgi:hypothetical protein
VTLAFSAVMVEIPGVWQYAFFTDTEGNRVSSLQPTGMYD